MVLVDTTSQYIKKSIIGQIIVLISDPIFSNIGSPTMLFYLRTIS